MTHKDILKVFGQICPNIKYKMWWKKGHNIVRLRLGSTKNQDIFFTYFNDIDWKIETISMFEKSKNGPFKSLRTIFNKRHKL